MEAVATPSDAQVTGDEALLLLHPDEAITAERLRATYVAVLRLFGTIQRRIASTAHVRR